MSKASRASTQRRRAVRYDPRSKSFQNRALVSALIALALAMFTGSAQYATWPQVLLLHQIGWSLVALFAAAAIVANMAARRLESRAWRALNAERIRQAAVVAAERAARLADLSARTVPVTVVEEDRVNPFAAELLPPPPAVFTAPAPTSPVPAAAAAELVEAEPVSASPAMLEPAIRNR